MRWAHRTHHTVVNLCTWLLELANDAAMGPWAHTCMGTHIWVLNNSAWPMEGQKLFHVRYIATVACQNCCYRDDVNPFAQAMMNGTRSY